MIPQFTGVYLMPETIAKLAEHSNIIGLKESSGDLSALKDLFRELKTGEFNVMVGGPSIFTQGLDAGAAGAVFAVAALAPNTCLAVEHAHRHGNYERAGDLQKRLAALARVTAASGVGHLKAAMDVVGMYGFMPRSPMPVPTEAERAEIEQAIAESGFFEKNEDGNWVEREDLIAPEYAD
jgi:dihydrodipicolinate synthase/N-acetylneuraminate lyase